MKKIRKILILMIAMTILACGILPYEVTITKKDTGETGEQATVTNTAMAFDTNTPIATSTNTLVSSSTLAPSSTPISTKTPIPSKTPTLTATKTKTPTKTTYYCPQAAIGTPCP